MIERSKRQVNNQSIRLEMSHQCSDISRLTNMKKAQGNHQALFESLINEILSTCGQAPSHCGMATDVMDLRVDNG